MSLKSAQEAATCVGNEDLPVLPKVVIQYLPATVHDEDRWYGKFIPTIIHFLGTRLKNPWCLSVCDLPILQDIWMAVYGKTIFWIIEVDDCVYTSVSVSIDHISYSCSFFLQGHGFNSEMA